MPATAKPSAWDFSEAHKLLDSFAYPKHENCAVDTELSTSASPSAIDDRQSHSKPATALGNFSKVFEILQNDAVQEALTNIPSEPPSYTSDGAAHGLTHRKRVKWHGEPELSTSPDERKPVDSFLRRHASKADPESTDEATMSTPTNRKSKKIRPGKDKRGKKSLKSVSDFESESEIRPQPKHTPAHKASRRQSHFLSIITKESNRSARPILLKDSVQTEASNSVENTIQAKSHVVPLQPAPLDTQSTAKPSPLRYSTDDLFQILQQSYETKLPAHVTQPWSVSLPSWNIPSTASRMTFQPSVPIMDKSDRDFQLRLKLIYSFPEDKQWLMAAVPFANHFNTEAAVGIHVFVDFSNISIGYMQKVSQLRLAAQRNNHFLRMGYQLSFDSLVLLLERGRPVAKRVLAGSTPSDPAIAKAKAIGYDVKILQKVYKDDGLTELERRAAAINSTPSPQPDDSQPLTVTTVVSNGLTTHSVRPARTPSNASRHVPTTPPPALATPDAIATKGSGRWVEQGVDEILHNKIYESVIDAESPSTIVLATGDGAQAEFSDGFVATVERALNRGWKVELVAWKKAMNYSWRRESWIKKWEGRFRIMELDGWEGFLEEVAT